MHCMNYSRLLINIANNTNNSRIVQFYRLAYRLTYLLSEEQRSVRKRLVSIAGALALHAAIATDTAEQATQSRLFKWLAR